MSVDELLKLFMYVQLMRCSCALGNVNREVALSESDYCVNVLM